MLAFDSGQAPLRHTRGPAESCFLPDLTRFTGSRCAGPDPQRFVRVVPLGGPSLEREFSPPDVGLGYRAPRAPRLARSSPGGYTAPGTIDAPGGVRERPNRHAWKACVGQLTVGSNPTPSARCHNHASRTSACCSGIRRSGSESSRALSNDDASLPPLTSLGEVLAPVPGVRPATPREGRPRSIISHAGPSA